MSENRESEVSRYGDPIFKAETEPEVSSRPSRKGSHKVLNRMAAVAIGVGAILTPQLAASTLAEGTVLPSLVELSQSNHDLVFDHISDIHSNDRNYYYTGWFLNKVGENVNQDFVQYGANGSQNLGNGFTVYPSDSPDKNIPQRVITDKDGNVVFKNAIVGPLLKNKLQVVMISPLLTSRPSSITPAPEYGDGMMRLSFPDQGLAVISKPTSNNPSFDDVYALEGFIAVDSDQYKTNTWIIADNNFTQPNISDNTDQ